MQHVGFKFLNQGSSQSPLHWEHGVLTSGPSGKSQDLMFFNITKWSLGKFICHHTDLLQVYWLNFLSAHFIPLTCLFYDLQCNLLHLSCPFPTLSPLVTTSLSSVSVFASILLILNVGEVSILHHIKGKACVYIEKWFHTRLESKLFFLTFRLFPNLVPCCVGNSISSPPPGWRLGSG